jgi:hypothetical protein
MQMLAHHRNLPHRAPFATGRSVLAAVYRPRASALHLFALCQIFRPLLEGAPG